MQITFAVMAVTAAAFAAAAPQVRQNCYEALQFGIFSVSPYNVTVGDTLSISADFTCAIDTYGHVPVYTDYYIEVPVNNNGYEPPILLARRNFPAGSTSDQFTVQVPDARYFNGAGYVVMLETTFPINGTNGIPYYVVGGVEAPINITVSYT